MECKDSDEPKMEMDNTTQDPSAWAQKQSDETSRFNLRCTTHPYLAVAILCFINLINYMDRFTIAGVLHNIQKDFEISDSTSGLLQTVFICSFLLLAPLFGYLGDRYNRKVTMSVGIIIWTSVTFGSSFVSKSQFWLLLVTRGLVGIGETCFSTIAPTIIGDLFASGKRTRVLSIFYLFIPVGSGMGFVLGAGMQRLTGDWHWAFRVTPCLGGIGLILLCIFVPDPKRGASEHFQTVSKTSWSQDIKYLFSNHSFLLSTMGVTTMAFVAGALGFWMPLFLFRAQVAQGAREDCLDQACSTKESLIFGALTVATGVIGVIAGAEIARRYKKNPHADPTICAIALLITAPSLFFAIVLAQTSIAASYVFITIGEIFLSFNWAIVADMLLYVVIPTRRSTAEAFQITVGHLLGDAGSPYLVGIVSDAIKSGKPDTNVWKFRSLKYSFTICTFVAVLGGVFFLLTIRYIKDDKEKAQQIIKGDEKKGDIPG
ncbi:protein spinster homolog 3-like [Protopterus annectens]|uniref:protein spinster homolog 3-like n=1 Tax=Protopterus annectens TaxID=7888 RepID=UPI001CF9EDC4|nr:protein spinster homolog 3-like [Protopterus annectens]